MCTRKEEMYLLLLGGVFYREVELIFHKSYQINPIEKTMIFTNGDKNRYPYIKN